MVIEAVIYLSPFFVDFFFSGGGYSIIMVVFIAESVSSERRKGEIENKNERDLYY